MNPTRQLGLRHQRSNRLAQINAVWTVARVFELGVGINAEQMKDRRGKIARREGIADWLTGVSVGLADDLAGADASASEETGEDVSPVMTAGSEDFAAGVFAAGRDR